MTVFLLCWLLASHVGIQPLDKESTQQKAAVDGNQTNRKIEPSNPVPSSQSAANKKPTDNQTLTNYQAWDWHKAFAPEYLSNWALVAVGLGATFAALLTLCSIRGQAEIMERQTAIAEMALKLAERADIQLDAAGPTPSHALDGDTRIFVKFKNFGRTRAENVLFKVALFIPGIIDGVPFQMPPIVMGAGETQIIPFQRFRDWLREDTFRQIQTGQLSLKFRAEVSYQDVFGEKHTFFGGGAFQPQEMTFAITDKRENQNQNPN